MNWLSSNKQRWKYRFKKSISGELENYSKPNYIAEISSKGRLPCKILETIPTVDQERALTNEAENKKSHDDA